MSILVLTAFIHQWIDSQWLNLFVIVQYFGLRLFIETLPIVVMPRVVLFDRYMSFQPVPSIMSSVGIEDYNNL